MMRREGESDKIFGKSVFLNTFKHNQDLKYLPLQSKACLTFEFITRRVLSNHEIPYQALISQNKTSNKENYEN